MERNMPSISLPVMQCSATGADVLSHREREILCAIGQGMTSREISRHLHISHHTVNTHRRNIRTKTGIHTTSGLVRASLFCACLRQAPTHSE
jgi:DNA-binding CsgD family transcriptional regulator